MIKISKAERDYLVNNGIRLGENGISHTWNSNKHYYLCERSENMKILNKYRKECVRGR